MEVDVYIAIQCVCVYLGYFCMSLCCVCADHICAYCVHVPACVCHICVPACLASVCVMCYACVLCCVCVCVYVCVCVCVCVDSNYCPPGGFLIVTLYMIVEDKHGYQQYSKPRQPIAGHSNTCICFLSICFT